MALLAFWRFDFDLRCPAADTQMSEMVSNNPSKTQSARLTDEVVMVVSPVALAGFS
ncbi:MAG TPA: hypothetical protein VGB17_17760 [Pyrinomonadaceae bacterium]|jgi:hypothetical protein